MASSSFSTKHQLFRRGSIAFFPPRMSELRIIQLGSSWSDKSSVANFLLGPNTLNKNKESNTSIKVSGMIKTTETVIINTPDLLCQSISEPRLREHVEHCVGLSAPGPHVFLLVVDHNISDQQKKRLYRILDLFSNDSFKHSLVLISTPGSHTMDTNYPYQRPLQNLIRMCGDRWIRLQQEPQELLWSLSQILRNNFGEHVVCGGPRLKSIKEDSFPLDSPRSRGELHQHNVTSAAKEVEDYRNEQRTHSMENVRPDYELYQHKEESSADDAEDFRTELRRRSMAYFRPDSSQLQQPIQASAMENREQEPVTHKSFMSKLGVLSQTPGRPEPQRPKPIIPGFTRSSRDTTRFGYRENPNDIRIVVIGKTGSGKSSSANTILGRKTFEAKLTQNSVTKRCAKEKTEIDGRSVFVVDTPGIFDNSLSPAEIQEELGGCINYVAPGPHVFLLVIRIGRFTPEEKESLRIIKNIFGENSEKFTIVLLTGGDSLEQDGQTVEDYIKNESNYSFKKLIADCGGRYHVFKNHDVENRAQVRELIRKIDTMVKENGGKCFTNEMLQKAEAAIQKKMETIKKEKEGEIKKKEEELKKKTQSGKRSHEKKT